LINYRSRLVKLQQQMRDNGIDGFLVTQNVDIYYLTGTMQSGYVFVPAEGEAICYIRRSVVRAQSESAVIVESLGSFRDFGSRLAADFPEVFGKSGTTIATEFDVLPVAVYQRLQAVLPSVRWTDGSTIIRELRMIKSPVEIAKIKEAAYIIDKALQKAVAHVRSGMTELELMSFIELSIRLEGHTGMMRMRGYNQELTTGMVGAGSSAAQPTYFDGPAGGEGLTPAFPQSAGRRPIGTGEPILVDIGCCIDGYVIDQTRTLVIGELPQQLLSAYETSEQILRSIEHMLRPGTVCQDIYAAALSEAKSAGLEAHFMGYGADQVKFVGHGIGLEIDELPVLARGFAYPLQPGMVIAVEPKFTFPGQGVVGIEDTYAITEHGFERLTCSASGLIRLPDRP